MGNAGGSEDGCLPDDAVVCTDDGQHDSEDDDDELFYKKDIPDYAPSNLIIMTGERDNVQVPLPYGINLFSNLGTILAGLAFGVKDLADAGMFLALSGHSSFSDCVR